MIPQNTSFSVIIPTFNEENQLQLTLDSVNRQHQVIVVDGGSSDKTVHVAQRNKAIVLQCIKGRAGQLNKGAREATGEILIFLHADTILPAGYTDWVKQKILQEQCIAGAFKLALNSDKMIMKCIAWAANARSSLLQFPYGDQALFMKAVAFHKEGGFPDIPVMEDFALIQQLKKRGRIGIADAAVISSDRRWQRLGIIRTALINQLMIGGYLFGVSPQFLAKFYSV